jgi:hypothetical protein
VISVRGSEAAPTKAASSLFILTGVLKPFASAILLSSNMLFRVGELVDCSSMAHLFGAWQTVMCKLRCTNTKKPSNCSLDFKLLTF